MLIWRLGRMLQQFTFGRGTTFVGRSIVLMEMGLFRNLGLVSRVFSVGDQDGMHSFFKYWDPDFLFELVPTNFHSIFALSVFVLHCIRVFVQHFITLTWFSVSVSVASSSVPSIVIIIWIVFLTLYFSLLFCRSFKAHDFFPEEFWLFNCYWDSVSAANW